MGLLIAAVAYFARGDLPVIVVVESFLGVDEARDALPAGRCRGRLDKAVANVAGGVVGLDVVGVDEAAEPGGADAVAAVLLRLLLVVVAHHVCVLRCSGTVRTGTQLCSACSAARGRRQGPPGLPRSL